MAMYPDPDMPHLKLEEIEPFSSDHPNTVSVPIHVRVTNLSSKLTAHEVVVGFRYGAAKLNSTDARLDKLPPGASEEITLRSPTNGLLGCYHGVAWAGYWA